MDRRIQFEGISNARDLGGMTAAGGKTVRRKRLIRSANLSKATPADIKKLREEYDLRQVIDLRTSMASRQKSDVPIEGVTNTLISVFDDAMIGITHESDRDYARRKTLMPKMTDLYRMMVTQPACRQRFRDILTLIMSREEGSVLWHCSEGKDRCGLTSAFLLTILGVDRGQILEDYLMTNEVALDRADWYYRQVLENGGDEAVAASVRDSFIVREEYLASAFEAIEAEFGSLERFITEGIGVDETLAGAFRERMLV